METPKIVFLWSHVRSVSTAFERAFIQREDYVTFHEPFGEPSYFGPERIYSYYDNELSEHAEYLNVTFSQMIEQILKPTTSEEKKNVFVKDMARHVVRPDYKSHRENPTVLPIEFLKRCKHTFILRTPRKSVPSLYRAYVRNNLKFIHDDIGYPELQALFEFLTELTGTPPALVEAGDLVEKPEAIMRMYCESGIGDRFEAQMLEWKAERVEAFDKWSGWHDMAQYSTGFNQCQRATDNNDELILPDDVQEVIEKSMPIYEKLREFKLRV
ncbi:unnamed protein product [Rotaria socialis]|uniref:Sulfotransferase family protein n=1 Tax=Rotaria socialis TaxID=392032 RepID=A0A818IB47_9BILA|nr:unnamed protein product [Rotaria socialis]CAF4311389.1 unnamed protein product [Rotaria socialis]